MRFYSMLSKTKEQPECVWTSSVFDTINHTILNTVMENYFALKDTALLWLSSYISDRQFSLK